MTIWVGVTDVTTPSTDWVRATFGPLSNVTEAAVGGVAAGLVTLTRTFAPSTIALEGIVTPATLYVVAALSVKLVLRPSLVIDSDVADTAVTTPEIPLAS
jgi:hypothetical protein